MIPLIFFLLGMGAALAWSAYRIKQDRRVANYKRRPLTYFEAHYQKRRQK